MPKLAADQAHADATAAQFLKYPGLDHLRVRKHGGALVIESGPADDAFKHARVVRDTVSLWGLDIADHRGRWGPTGDRGTRDEVVATLVEQYGWVLTDITGDHSERTSDPKY
jgi:hypothetical protein